MATSVGFAEVVASLVLVAIAAALGYWMRLGVTRQLVIAVVRAGVQLLAVGFLLTLIVESRSSQWWAWVWVVFMVVMTSTIAQRRTPQIPGGGLVTLAAVGLSTAVCLAVIFGLGVIDYEPITVVVISGITIGNALPSIVLGGKRVVESLHDGRGKIEALLALGFDVGGIIRVAGADIVRTALIPQIERTNVVGLIALPGAMTGLLLAGADPITAVLVQIIVMYLVLGAVAVSVIVTVVLGIRASFTDDLRLVTSSYGP